MASSYGPSFFRSDFTTASTTLLPPKLCSQTSQEVIASDHALSAMMKVVHDAELEPGQRHELAINPKSARVRVDGARRSVELRVDEAGKPAHHTLWAEVEHQRG